MNKMYCRHVDGFVVMLDVTMSDALDRAHRWILNYAMNADVPRILVANKVCRFNCRKNINQSLFFPTKALECESGALFGPHLHQ